MAETVLLPKPDPEPAESEPISLPTLSPNRADENRRIASFLSSCKKKGKRMRRSDGRPSQCLHRVSSITHDEHLSFCCHLRLTRLFFSSLRSQLPRSGLRHRFDLSSATKMKSSSLWLHRDRRIIGPLPGLNIGDSFLYRVELCVVSPHGQIQAGIDFVPSATEPIATSIVVSGNYEDDVTTAPTTSSTPAKAATRVRTRPSIPSTRNSREATTPSSAATTTASRNALFTAPITPAA